MHDARLADTEEFGELAWLLLMVWPDAPERALNEHYAAWNQRDRDYAASRLIAYGKTVLPAVLEALDREAQHVKLSKQPSISRLPVVLARLAPDSVPYLQKALHSPTPHVRRQAVRAAGLDPVGDAISLADDRHVVTTPNPIDGFGEGPVQVVVEHPVQDSGVHRVGGPPGLGRRPCAVPPKGGRSQEKGEGKNQEPATRKGLPGHE